MVHTILTKLFKWQINFTGNLIPMAKCWN